MEAWDIRGWLLIQPRAHRLRVTAADGAQHEIAPSGTAWARVAETCFALQPELIEAFDQEGKLLRACRPQEKPEDEPEEHRSKAKASSTETDLRVFAGLIAEAYRHANDVAFARMVDVFDATNRRSESLERSLAWMERLVRKQLEDQLEHAGEQTDPLSQLAAAFATGAAAAPQQPAPAPAPNGQKNGKG